MASNVVRMGFRVKRPGILRRAATYVVALVTGEAAAVRFYMDGFKFDVVDL